MGRAAQGPRGLAASTAPLASSLGGPLYLLAKTAGGCLTKQKQRPFHVHIQLRDKIGVGSDLGRAIEVGLGNGTRFLTTFQFVRVLKAGFGRAVEVKFDCTSKSELGH